MCGVRAPSAAWASPCSVKADVLLHDGQEFDLAGFHIKMIQTPGHTAGSCCFYFPAYELLISGDTLFHGSYGRTDLPTGNDGQILASVRRLLRELPEVMVITEDPAEPFMVM